MEKITNAMMAVAAVAAAVVGGGCAAIGASEPSVAPTHRWVADVSSTKYNFDNKLCAERSMVDDGDNSDNSGGDHSAQSEATDAYMQKGAPEFAAYQQCMQSRGYELATY